MKTNKDTIELSRKSLKETVVGLSDGLFNSFEEIISKIEDYDKKLTEKASEYASLEKEISDKVEYINNELLKIERLRAEHDESVSLFRSEVVEFNSKKDKSEKELSVAVSQKDKTLASISKLQEQLKSLELKKKSMDILTESLASINGEIRMATERLSKVNSEFEEMTKTMNKSKANAQKELDGILSEIQSKQSVVIPTIEEANARLAAAKTKENDIQIIIDRYKDLYAEKGAGFKI